MSERQENTIPPRVQFCSLVSEASGEDPIGSAWSTERFILIELPLPWAYELFASKHVPEGLRELVYGFYAQGLNWGILAMAPDPDYSVAGTTRVLDYELVADVATGTAFVPREFLVPTSELVSFLAAYASAALPPEHERYRQERALETRDIFVCTHGAVDACCAKFGYPVYRELRRLAGEAGTSTRVWRCTHFGGHRFAATILELPDGRYWGRLKRQHLSGIINHDLTVGEMRPCYRGWAALPHPVQQVAEAAAFVRGGWEWTRCAVMPGPAPEDEAATGGRITFGYRHPAGEAGEITVDVCPDGEIRTMNDSAIPELMDAQQYRAEVVKISPAGGLLDREMVPALREAGVRSVR